MNKLWGTEDEFCRFFKFMNGLWVVGRKQYGKWFWIASLSPAMWGYAAVTVESDSPRKAVRALREEICWMVGELGKKVKHRKGGKKL